MKIAICLFNYFPFGGLQRDFLRIAKTCVSRGHSVHVFTMKWEGPAEPDLNVHVIQAKGLTNHGKARSFSDQVQGELRKGEYDVVVGFNKMPGLDLYYAADVCYKARVAATKGAIYRAMPRYKTWASLEQSVFNPASHTQILLISELQKAQYQASYGTSDQRFTLLPPGISRDRLALENAGEIRQQMREKWQHAPDDNVLLMVGSGFKTKGLDRALYGLASLPEELQKRTHLYVIGKGDAAIYMKMANQLGIARRVSILGPRNDVPAFLLAADLLLHPSYHENTGTAILEALAAGLPVLTTAVCGYAHYVTDANAGMVLPEAFDQKKWNDALQKMLSSGQLKMSGANGLSFAKQADIYSMPERATDLIEKRVSERAIVCE